MSTPADPTRRPAFPRRRSEPRPAEQREPRPAEPRPPRPPEQRGPRPPEHRGPRPPEPREPRDVREPRELREPREVRGPRICRVCGVEQALPDDDACGPCGDKAIERARAGVDAWLGTDAERVRELERNERARAERA